MEFSTVINCMDGRVQVPVISYLQKRFNVEFVDVITEAGPNLILAEGKDEKLVESILARVDISISVHSSNALAVTGHHGCAGNPASKEEQVLHLNESVEFLRGKYPNLEIIALWVDEIGEVKEIDNTD